MFGIIKVELNIKLLGFSLDQLHRYYEAIDCFDQAIKIDPNFVKALINKGKNWIQKIISIFIRFITKILRIDNLPW